MITPVPAPISVITRKMYGISGALASANCPPARPAMVLPMAVPRNQVPIMRLTNFGGASLVTFDKPTGDRQSSPNVWNR